MELTLPALAFFGIGDTEMLVIMVVVLILFGGQKMPDFARGLGKALRELRRATGDVEREFKRVMEEAEDLPRSFPKPGSPAPMIHADSLPGTPAGDGPAVIPQSGPPPPPPSDGGAEYHPGP